MAKKRIINAHDKFVKEMFADKEMVIAFLQNKLPKSILNIIDLQSISKENSTFINKELSESFADIVLKFKSINQDKELYISILIENKSIPDEYVVFQLLEYISSAYRIQIKMQEKPRPVIPFIYYHGNQEWHLKSIGDFFNDYPHEVKEYIPFIRSIFVSLRDMTDEQIGKVDNKLLYSALMMQRYRYDVKRLEDNLEQLLNSLNEYSDWNFLKTMIVYSINVTELTEAKIIEIADKGDEKIKGVIMSTYNHIFEKGIEKGIEKGVELTKVEMVLKGHDNKLSLSLLSNISGLSEAEILNILKTNNRIN